MEAGATLLSILAGCVLIIWRRWFGALVVRNQNRMWGFRFGEREERISAFVATVVGLGFLAVGILGSLGFLHWKPGMF